MASDIYGQSKIKNTVAAPVKIRKH